MLTCLGAKTVVFDKKYTVMAEGSVAKYVAVVLSGSVQLMRVDIYGNRSIISKVTQGQMFAEEFACAKRELPISAVADKPSEIMLIKCDRILHTCANGCGFHHRLIYNLMNCMARKNIEFHQKIEVVSKRSTSERLLAYLSMEAKRQGRNEFDIPFDRQELADYLEVDRSGLSVQISKLADQGVLKYRKNHFELL
jgi:CRP-like cAMP-binding protein